jgi:PKD repeat protein
VSRHGAIAAAQSEVNQAAYKKVITAHTTITYSVRMTATNAGGSNTKTLTNYITVTR